MKKIIVIMGMLLSLGLFSACSSDEDVQSEESTAQALYGKWQVLGYGSDDNFTAKENNWTGHPFLIFKEDGSFEGWIDNDLVGTYTFKENGEFTITRCGGTKVLSTNPHIVYMEEQVWGKKIKSYKLLDNELRLFYSESEYLLFRKE